MPFERERPLESVCVMTGVKSVTPKGVRIMLDDRRSFELAKAQLPDGPVVVRIEPADEARSLAQNRFYRSVLMRISAETGVAVNTLHEHYKEMFNGGRTTTELDRRAFATYVEQVMADAGSEHGVSFPAPMGDL